MEHFENKEYPSSEDMEKIMLASHVFNDLDPDDTTIFGDSSRWKNVVERFNKYLIAIEQKTKGDEPATIQEFLLVMNNFILHFVEGEAGYSDREYVKECLEKEPEFKELAHKISLLANAEHYDERIHQPEIGDIFTDAIDEKYQLLYRAYLLLRTYNSGKEVELHR